MPGLLIHVVNGNWVAAVANTPIQYNFVGATLNQQIGSVQNLAFAMTNDAIPLAQSIGNAIVLPQGVQGAQAVNSLFSTTDLLIFQNKVIYGTVEDEVLGQYLNQAGDALIAELITP